MQITKSQLQQIIKEEVEALLKSDQRYNEEGIKVPPEPEFVDSVEDKPAGYIAVYDDRKEHLIAIAPIVQTDGPDRPFLVRTTDTSWRVPQHIVNMIYPDIEEIFNEIDSQLPWADLGPGSSGSKDGLTWVWESEYTKETS